VEIATANHGNRTRQSFFAFYLFLRLLCHVGKLAGDSSAAAAWPRLRGVGLATYFSSAAVWHHHGSTCLGGSCRRILEAAAFYFTLPGRYRWGRHPSFLLKK